MITLLPRETGKAENLGRNEQNMSASREKKKRQELMTGGTTDPKAAREAEARADARKTNILYGTLGVIFVVLAVFLLVVNSGILERNKTAVTIDGETYSVAEVSYYYNSAYQNFITSQNGYYATALGMLDTNTPLKSQSYDETQTWDDYFKGVAVENMQFVHAAKKAAQDAGMTLGEEEMETFNSTIDSLKSSAASNGYSYKSYVAAIYGPSVTTSIYESCLKDYMLANMYANDYYDQLSYTDDEIQSYYEENKNTYDLVDGVLVTISGSPEVKTDADGKTIAATDEEKAEAVKKAKEAAEEIQAAYKDGEDIQDLVDEIDAGYSVDSEMTYTDSVYGNWFFDDARRAGDTDILENDSGNTFYFVAFNDRKQDDALDYNVRHILITGESLELGEDEEATEEMLTAKAQEILDTWDGSEEGFANLANEYSKDPGSNTTGGLYEDVPKGRMVAPFQEWCYESGRKTGDTGVVYNSGTGAHIMYFVGYGDTPYWHYACDNALKSEAYNDWYTEMTESAPAEVDESGMDKI